MKIKQLLTVLFLSILLTAIGTQAAQAVTPGRWMTELHNVISDKKLHEIFIPGTHDSGSWALGKIPFAQTQSLDIKGQLNQGARYFDLRITYVNIIPGFKSNTFYLHHGGTSMPIALELAPQLQVIKTFLDQNPKEIVILHIRQEWLCDGLGLADCKGMAPYQKSRLIELLRSYFPENRIATTSEVENKSIKYLTDTRKIVIDWHKQAGFADAISFNYMNAPDGISIPDRVIQMAEYHEKELRRAATNNYLNAMHPVIAAPDVYTIAKIFAFPATKNWLDKWYKDPETRKGLNIVAVDYIEASGIFDQLMGFNQQLSSNSSEGSGGSTVHAALWYGNYSGSENGYLFGKDEYFRHNKASGKTDGPFTMSEWKLHASMYTLDAALYYGQYKGSEMTYLFKGAQYYSYNKTKDKLEGPYNLNTNWKLPSSWKKVDAAVYYGQYQGSEMVYFFNGNQYYSYNKSTDEAKGPYDLHSNWKVPAHWKNIDAAFYYGDYRGGESIYLFYGNEYGRYNKSTDKFDGPYPISDNWF